MKTLLLIVSFLLLISAKPKSYFIKKSRDLYITTDSLGRAIKVKEVVYVDGRVDTITYLTSKVNKLPKF